RLLRASLRRLGRGPHQDAEGGAVQGRRFGCVHADGTRAQGRGHRDFGVAEAGHHSGQHGRRREGLGLLTIAQGRAHLVRMKYVILLGDGMGDHPLAELGGRTPLQAAKTPHLDFLARNGELGLVKTTPDGFYPGGDVTQLASLGYDPKKYYTGLAPLEAAGLGVTLNPDDVAYRCNLATLRADPASQAAKQPVPRR